MGVPSLIEVSRWSDHTPTFRVFFMLTFNDVRQNCFHVGLEIVVIIIALLIHGLVISIISIVEVSATLFQYRDVFFDRTLPFLANIL